jgi:Resolvase, N terminal domain
MWPAAVLTTARWVDCWNCRFGCSITRLARLYGSRRSPGWTSPRFRRCGHYSMRRRSAALRLGSHHRMRLIREQQGSLTTRIGEKSMRRQRQLRHDDPSGTQQFDLFDTGSGGRILYVRQSSPHQVLHNRESSALQYAMRDRLIALGWSEIETVDDDLGRSAAGGVARAGFERMVAEVCLGKVGAVAAREVSRFARNSHDWQQLIEMCRVVDTVLIDQEAVYAPRQGNDRLLLGLKGSLNEYELDLLRQRSLSARYEKARRGELVVAAIR